MYEYSVPIISRRFTADDREAIASLLSKMGVKRVFLSVISYIFDDEERRLEFKLLRENCAFLKERGFDVGTWIWTFMDTREKSDFVRMRFVSGEESRQSVCPSDPAFRAFAADYICDIAACGVDIIMYDDDYRYGNLGGQIGCLCDNHLAYMSEVLGREVTREMLADKLFSGGENEYRSAWLKSKRYYFELFAREMRAALDRVRPEVRLGVCSCYPDWDQDGISTYEIAKLLAGENTRPFLRLSAAPFWVTQGLAEHRMQDVIELTRMELAFCEGDTYAEIVGEGDSHPRPRWSVPASFLEGMDTALRADGGVSGMLKYSFDYTGSYKYETGYNERHIANMPIYEKIDKMFGDKRSIGLRVFEYREKYEKMDIPEYLPDYNALEFTFFPYAARMLAAANIPTVYTDTDTVGIAFGENAKYIPREALKNGLIIDARAAEILTERGIDVGLVSKGERVGICKEIYTDTGESTHVFASNDYATKAYLLEVKDGAKIESRFNTLEAGSFASYDPTKKKGSIIASYSYENAEGERFLVFAFDGTLMHRSLFRHYERADLLKRAVTRLGCGVGFDVVTSPDLYVLAKEGAGRIAVGLWNFSADDVRRPTIRIADGKRARVASTINCEVVSEGEEIVLSRMEPFGFAAVEFEIL